MAWAVYDARIDSLENQVRSYESVQGANLPGLIQELAEVASQANANIKLEDLSIEHERVLLELQQARDLNAELQKQVTLEQELILAEGESDTILNGTIVMAVTRLYDTNATVVYDNSLRSWDVGEHFSQQFGGTEFRIRLAKISDANPDTATFFIEKLQNSSN
ncbi:MAG: hypothetical protein ACE5Q6_03355 [Dehalococcoidia bacterium]